MASDLIGRRSGSGLKTETNSHHQFVPGFVERLPPQLDTLREKTGSCSDQHTHRRIRTSRRSRLKCSGKHIATRVRIYSADRTGQLLSPQAREDVGGRDTFEHFVPSGVDSVRRGLEVTLDKTHIGNIKCSTDQDRVTVHPKLKERNISPVDRVSCRRHSPRSWQIYRPIILHR